MFSNGKLQIINELISPRYIRGLHFVCCLALHMASIPPSNFWNSIIEMEMFRELSSNVKSPGATKMLDYCQQIGLRASFGFVLKSLLHSSI